MLERFRVEPLRLRLRLQSLCLGLTPPDRNVSGKPSLSRPTGGYRPKPLAFALCPPDEDTIEGVYSFGPGSTAGFISLIEPLDSEIVASGDLGIEVFDGISWVPCIGWSWDPLMPLEIDFVFETLPDPSGMLYRLVPTLTSQTAGGKMLKPVMGVVQQVPEMMMKSAAAKIAAIKALRDTGVVVR